MKKAVQEIEGQDYEVIESSEVIAAQGKLGKKWWQAHIVEAQDGVRYTTTCAWHETPTGGISKIMWAVPRQARVKNAGRANATSNHEQAQNEFESMVTLEKRLRSGDRIMPMLAATFEDKVNPKKSKKAKIKYPCIVQPKFDGKRLLSDGEVAWSRGNKDTNPETFAHIAGFDTQGMIVDGELLLPWLPGEGAVAPKVNEVMSAVNKFHPGVSDTLIYVLYDIADPTRTYEERKEILQNWYEASGVAENPNIIVAASFVAQDESEVWAFHKRITALGYEGSIIRNLDGLYADGKRVSDLQKLKDFITKEFRIKNVVPSGEGIGERRAKFVCETEEGVEFESNATGSEANQLAMLDMKEDLIGRWATVKFREYTTYGAPFHSNVLEVRETKNGGY